MRRVVADTFSRYQELLWIARRGCTVGSAWEGSYGQRVIDAHAQKLTSIRRNSSGYISFVLGVYAHLRDAGREGYMTKGMIRRVVTNQSDGVAVAAGTGANLNTPIRCGHCRNNNLHGGGGDACPGRALTPNVARRLFRDLTSTTVPQVLRAAVVLTLNSITASTTEEEAIALGRTVFTG